MSVSFIYEGQYACFKKCIGSTTMEPINCLAQEVRLGAGSAKAFSIQAGLEHYFNDSINGKDRNMLFADASLSYKRGRFEYMIEAHNLTNSKAFSSFAYNDIMSYCYTTTLRPLAVMLTLRFSLR